MPCNKRYKNIPLPCQELARARAQMALLMSGGAVTVVETPQLGRVEYAAPPSVAELQRYIDALAAQCLAAGGDAGAGMMRRKPLSFEAWP